MKRVIKYESNDGKLFDNREEALKHDRYLELEKEYYDTDAIYSHSCVVNFELLAGFIRDNKKLTRKLVKEL